MTRQRRIALLLLVALIVATVPGQLPGDEPLEVKPVRIDGTDITAMTDLDLYKYEIPLRKGQKVKVTLDVQMEENAEPINYLTHSATASKDGSATLTAGFLREDRKLASVFLSEEQRMGFRIRWDGVATGGLNGFIKNPLGWIPLGEKALTIHQVPKISDRTAQLLLLFGTKSTEGKRLPLLFPRAGLHVEVID